MIDFTERNLIEDMYYEFIQSKKALDCKYSFILFLCENELLNEEKVKEFITKHKNNIKMGKNMCKIIYNGKGETAMIEREKIAQQINEIIANGTIEVMDFGENALVVKFTTKGGFTIMESCCGLPSTYNRDLAKEICINKLKNSLVMMETYCLLKK